MSRGMYADSKAFALRIVRLYRWLCEEKQEYVLSKQILRSGTSIGANLAEAQCASSRKDFLNKQYIALKECSETIYWIDLLYASEYITKDQYNSLYADCLALRKMLMASTKKLKEGER